MVYWFHSASLGEYEQIRPILSGLKEVEDDCICVVSFFSPSGYDHVKDDNIDCKIYLPFDFIWNCNRALKIVNPTKLIFAEYDVWPNFVWCAEKLNITTTLFSARIHSKSKKNLPLIKIFYKHFYRCIDFIYTISDRDYRGIRTLLADNGSGKSLIKVLGNPRYDSVKQSADEYTEQRTKSLINRPTRLIAGSVWPDDENVILNPLVEIMNKQDGLQLYWVPHEPNNKYIEKSLKSFEFRGFKAKLFSDCKNGELDTARLVLVDKVGILSRLYWKGKFAYIGGGFSKGIHNVMEPAMARLPVIMGPKYYNSDAAEELVNNGGGYPITQDTEFFDIVTKFLDNKEFYLRSSIAATDVIHKNIGSSTRVVRGIIRD